MCSLHGTEVFSITHRALKRKTLNGILVITCVQKIVTIFHVLFIFLFKKKKNNKWILR